MQEELMSFEVAKLAKEKRLQESLTLIPQNMAELAPHQQRVVDELNEVDNNLETIKERSSKLNEFIMDNPIYLTLPEEEQKDLKVQYQAMCIIQDRTVDYRDALMRRISRF